MSTPGDYAAVRKDIISMLKQPGYDDGSIGPILVRLAWHASGTYDKVTKTGGSNGATMRFAPESTDGANAGLENARKYMDEVKARNPWISYADLWTLAGTVAVEAMGGPVVPWRPGRRDHVYEQLKPDDIPPNGRLPDASQGAQHIRDVFGRMGFNDREMVALIGAHTVGRCHTDRSGYDGPWTYTPTRFSNQFFTLLLTVNWQKKQWDGPLQYVDPDDEIMTLPADLAFITDPVFRPIVEEYARDKEVFFKDFAAAFAKLLELGVVRDDDGKARKVQGPGVQGHAAAMSAMGATGAGCPFAGALRARL